MKDWIQKKLGIEFGLEYVISPDYLLFFRFGAGQDRIFANFECGILGYSVYFGRFR